MFFLAGRGYRCIAHDRRGHGRSSQPWQGNDMDTYADDLAELVKTLDLKDAIHVGHSTSGGEVARYIGRSGTSRVAKAVLIASVPPLMLKTSEDLKKFDVPTLIIQGDDDQIVPYADASLKQAKLIKGAELKIYKGAPHGMCTTLKNEVNADLLAFITDKGVKGASRAA
jgi:pimeloyl-ACP methyl ester carboxylesterase